MISGNADPGMEQLEKETAEVEETADVDSEMAGSQAAESHRNKNFASKDCRHVCARKLQH